MPLRELVNGRWEVKCRTAGHAKSLKRLSNGKLMVRRKIQKIDDDISSADIRANNLSLLPLTYVKSHSFCA